MPRSFRSYSFSSILMMIFSLLFIIIIGVLSFTQFNAVAEDRTTQFYSDISNTNLFLNHSASILFEALNLYDSRYDYEMEMTLKSLSDSYTHAGGDISQFNLTENKEEFSSLFPGAVDLYIINSSNIVEKTTYEPDLNLNFKKFSDFSQALDKVREGDRFQADEWVDSINTPGSYRKYAYLPTPDHRYVLEIGIYSDEFWEARKTTFSYEKLGSELTDMNPNLVAITFFNKKLDAIDANSGSSASSSYVSTYIPLENLKSTTRKVFSEQKSSIEENSSLHIEYQFFAARKTLAPSSSEMNLVGVLVYSKQNLKESLDNYLIIHLAITGLAIILSLIFALFISRYISRPLEQIIEDIEQISRGNYNHPIRLTGGSDIDRLGRSVQIMVSRIIRDIEVIQQSHNETAAELDKRKAAEKALILANEKLNNLSSITRHDILNQVTCIRGYAYLTENTSDPDEISHYSQDIQRLSKLIEEMIAFSRDYQTIGINELTWQNFNLVIHSAISDPFGNIISLKVDKTEIEILADPLLQKVFYNLVDNSLRHGGQGGDKIHILFRKEEGNGLIIYEDEGIGIPDEEKEKIFEHGYGTGTGLGLFLIREILGVTGFVITETGIYGSGVRFEITIPPSQYRVTPDSESQ